VLVGVASPRHGPHAEPGDAQTGAAQSAAAEGVADGGLYLYFTVVALGGVADQLSPGVRERDLFDEVQACLVDALRVLWELTQRYWSAVARFDADSWPL
jgi:hypothetical protein